MPIVSRPKQVIKDYCRHKKYSGPIYFLVHEEKIDLHKHYTVQLSINGVITSQGIGLSRRIAEFKAALNGINFISQSDPSILDHIKTDKYGRTINRSFSVDYITNANRSDSFVSMVTGHYGPSATPSIDGIDSMTIKSDYSPVISSSSNIHHNDNDTLNERHQNYGETSSDEGIFVEGSESSSAVPSPKLQIKNQQKTSSLKRTDSKSRFNFLSSFILLNSLRAISRQSFRRHSSSGSMSKSRTYNASENVLSEESSNVSRPTSSSSASSSSSTSSAFSSNSSISSSTPITQSANIINNVNYDESSKLSPEETSLINPNYSGLITQSIIEEEEEEDRMDNDNETSNGIERDNFIKDFHVAQNKSDNNNNGTNNYVEYRILRSLSSFYPLSNVCSHNHFSIYGPLLCNITTNCSNKRQPMESSALLLRYCVRMYLPLPYYDIRFNQKFLVTCRVVFSISKSNIGKLPLVIPVNYLDKEFTAKGNGDVLKTARNMAAECIIDKLKATGLYYEE